MFRLVFLCVISLALCAISIAQEYEYEADVSTSDISDTTDYQYESRSHYSESFSGEPREIIDPRHGSEAGTSSRQYGDEYLLKPGVFNAPQDSEQQQKLQKKVTDVTSGTLKTLMIFGLAAICLFAFILNNTR